MVINELLTNPRAVNWDGTGSLTRAQWLELYNPNGVPVSVANWRLTSGSGVAVLPAGDVVPAGGYLVIYRRDVGVDLAQAPVTIVDPAGSLVDSVSAPALPADQSYARVPDGSANWVVDSNPTLGDPNVLLPPATSTPELQATVFAIQTQVAEPLPSQPAAPQVDDGTLDAADLSEARKPRVSKSQPYRTLPIAAVRGLPDDTPVITSGVVTMPSGLWDSARGYIQAEGAGILVHTFGSPVLHLGDTLTIKGRVHHFRGEVEVAAIKNGQQIEAGGVLPEPRGIEPDAIGAGTEALLVQVSGEVGKLEREYATLEDAAGSGRVFVYSRLGMPSGSLKAGDTMSVTGVVNAADASSHRLVPRALGDIVIAGVPLGPRPSGSEPSPGAGRGASPGTPASSAAALLASPPDAEATAFATPVLASQQSDRGAPPTAASPAANVLVLRGGEGAGTPAWMWVCAGVGLALAGAGVGVGLGPKLRAWWDARRG